LGTGCVTVGGSGPKRTGAKPKGSTMVGPRRCFWTITYVYIFIYIYKYIYIYIYYIAAVCAACVSYRSDASLYERSWVGPYTRSSGSESSSSAAKQRTGARRPLPAESRGNRWRMSRPYFTFLISTFWTRAEVNHCIAKWRITVFSYYDGLIYIAI